MSSAERTLFINTYKTVSSPGPQYAQYQALIARHATNFATIHTSQYFLPWHRWFQMEMENLLQNVNCQVTMPWWDTAKNAGSPWGVSPWGASSDLLGTAGACVTNGGFASPGWPNNAHGCLSRTLSGTLPTSVQESTVLAMSSGNYVAFTDALETQIHNTAHVRVGGTMVQGWSPEAPEFFLHHGHVDKLWNDWQKKSNAHLNSYSFSLAAAMPVAMGATPAQFNDLKATGVMYVRTSASAAGLGHLTLGTCNLIIGFQFDLVDLQAAMFRVANVSSLLAIPQLAAPTLSDAEERMMIDMVRKGRGSESSVQTFTRKLATGKAALTKFNDALKKAGNLRTSFSKPSDKALGFDVEQAAKLLRISSSTQPENPSSPDYNPRPPSYPRAPSTSTTSTVPRPPGMVFKPSIPSRLPG